MEELTKELQDEMSWCMLFAEDIVIINEIINLNKKLDREALERKSFKSRRTNIKYLIFNFFLIH